VDHLPDLPLAASRGSPEGSSGHVMLSWSPGVPWPPVRAFACFLLLTRVSSCPTVPGAWPSWEAHCPLRPPKQCSSDSEGTEVVVMASALSS
jgi:hypothetical protein